MKIDGYQLFLPITWSHYHQSRIILYCHESINIKIVNHGIQFNDLPLMTCEIRFGHERKTVVNFFYREFKSGVTGLDDMASQTERLARMIKVWEQISDSNYNFVLVM